MEDIWKKFNEIELTHSSVHHLFAIYTLRKEHGYARAIDIARHLNITRGSVGITLNKLKKRDFIQEDENKFYSLTEKGRQTVGQALCQRRVAFKFFQDVLQLSPENAETEACKIEHVLEHDTGEKMLSFMRYFLSDQPEARAFRDGFEKFVGSCEMDGLCEFCDIECYVSDAFLKQVGNK